MLCDNIKPNLNIKRLVINTVNADIEITNKIKMNQVYFYWQSSLQI